MRIDWSKLSRVAPVRTLASELSGRGCSVAGTFVGIYWTLPVNWAGFRNLSPDVDAAAAASKTIRYQRERTRRYVHEDGGRMVAEIAFMDIRTDRATDTVCDVLRRRAPDFLAARPTVLTVRFDEGSHWRPNPFVLTAAAELGLPLVGLPPDPVLIGREVFDPRCHFAAWRKRDASAMTRLRLEAEEGLWTALGEVPAGEGRWMQVAALMNGRGVRTIRGGVWTADNVRKLAGRRRAGGS